MKNSKKIISLFLAAVTVITSLFCLTAVASATSNSDLVSEMRRFRVSANSKLDSNLIGYYKDSPQTTTFFVSGLNNKKGAAIEKLIKKDGYFLSAAIMLDSDVGFAIEGDAQAAAILNSVLYNSVTDVSLSKTGSGYKLILEVKADANTKKAIAKASVAAVSIRAVKSSNGKKTYYGGKSVYYVPFSSKDPTITKLSSLKAKKISSKIYKGRALTPDPELYDGSYKLRKGFDYTVSYRNNDEIGTATIVVKGKGSYTGKRTVKFTIIPKSPKFKRAYFQAGYVKVTWERHPDADKYYLYRSDDMGKTFRKIGTYNAGTTYAHITFPPGADYVIKMRVSKTVNGKTYYSGWSYSSEMVHSV